MVLNVTVNQSSGKITICIPSTILDEIMKKANIFSKTNRQRSDQSIEDQKSAIMDSIRSSKLTVTGVLGKTEATLQDILSMQIGYLIILNKDVNADVDVNVDGEKWFEGKWGTKKNKGVIKINKIIH